jgi:hypothetical protein
VALWYFVLRSGVHATVAGVLLAFTVPIARRIETKDFGQALRDVASDGAVEEVAPRIKRLEDLLEGAQSPLHRLEHALHGWVAYLVMPVFALFNTGVALGGSGDGGIGAVSLGAFLGLVVGKPLGVTATAWLAMRLRLATLSEGTSWGARLGVGILAGIGFTMSLSSPASRSETPRSWMRPSSGCFRHRSSPRSQVRPFSMGRWAGGRGSCFIQTAPPEWAAPAFKRLHEQTIRSKACRTTRERLPHRSPHRTDPLRNNAA